MKLTLTRLAAAAGGLALALPLGLSVGAGLASAEPDVSGMIDSPCTYDQAIAAVHAENPTAAQYLDSSPPNLQFVRVFLGSSRDERVNLLNQIKNNPGVDQALPVFQQMMTSCTKY